MPLTPSLPCPPPAQLELSIFRTAANVLLDLLRGQVGLGGQGTGQVDKWATSQACLPLL